MTQVATVRKILENGMAEVAVKRQSACAHDCADCAGCSQMVKAADAMVSAENKVNAQKGDIVIVESENSTILTAAAIVYLLPFVLFFLFYGIAAWLIGGGGIPVAMGFLGFAIGILFSIYWDRREKRRNNLRFWISEVKQRCSGT